MTQIVYIGKYNGIIGGIERYMQKSAHLLRRYGFAVHYLYTENGGKDQEDFASSFDSIQLFSTEQELLQLADLVIIHNIIPPELLSRIPQDKTLFFAHDHNIYCRRHHYYTPPFRTNCKRKYDALRCYLCSLGRNEAPPLETYRKLPALVLSDFMAENLRKNGFEKVFKLPAFISVPKQEHVFMPDGILRILFLGQLIRGKGADLMLEVLAKLDIPFICTIAGDGKDRPMLEQKVRDLHLEKTVHFSGFQSEPEKLWQNCDVFFFPIRWQEPFGLVGLEALAHGIPVAAFDLGGVREYLTPDCGALIPEKNLEQAVKILTNFYKDPNQLSRMGENGFTLTCTRFSEENFIKTFTQLLENFKS